jgi:hypothetical protein
MEQPPGVRSRSRTSRPPDVRGSIDDWGVATWPPAELGRILRITERPIPMSRPALILAILASLVVVSASAGARAQGSIPVAPCPCGVKGAHYHSSVNGTVFHPGSGSPGAGMSLGGNGGVSGGSAGPIYGLPRGRRYYGGRFFGSFNNRYYGPQYGNF